MIDQETDALLSEYRQAAEGTSHPDAREANKYHDQMHAAYRLLRNSEAGRAAIASLMSHGNPHVRCWSAAHSLQWQPESARSVLQKLHDENGPCSFDAEMTLDEYDKGHLSFEY